ncbi:MAG: small multi-drug export protein [Candidatus Peregrinibacteria bacterium]
MSPELTTLLTAMTPFLELKLAIPVGLKLGLSTTNTLLFATAGSMIPAALSLALFPHVSAFLMKHSKLMNRFFEFLFNKTRKRHTKNFDRYGAIFLILFVAIPLPGSGSTAGSLIAFLFGVNYSKAFALIGIGTLIAGIALTAGFESVFKMLDLFA